MSTQSAEHADRYDTHLLIAKSKDFTPKSEHVLEFLQGLSALEMTPLNPKITVKRRLAAVRYVRNPITGGKIPIPAFESIAVSDIASLPPIITESSNYVVQFEGQGARLLAPLDLSRAMTLTDSKPIFNDPESTFLYSLACEIRSEPRLFGASWRSRPRLFAQPYEPLGSLYACFSIQFSFGLWYLPEIISRRDLLDPRIVSNAERIFNLSFVEGRTIDGHSEDRYDLETLFTVQR